MSRYFKYSLLGTFFVAVLLIVYLYFNSNRSINELIEGNENLLEELAIKNNLQRLETGIASLESRTRGQIIRGAFTSDSELSNEIRNIEISLSRLDTLQSEQLISPALDDLKKMVHQTIIFNKQILDTFRISGKFAAEKLTGSQTARQRMDSINLIARKIDELHQRSVTELILQADTNVKKTRTIGSILALIAALTSIFTFVYTAIKVRSQEKLILRLNASEKKVRETATIKENFLANMSHEIRTPLNAIMGFTGLLKNRSLDRTSADYVSTIGKSGDHLLSIVNDILDLSKIEAGMMRIENAPFNIREQLHSLQTMFASEAQRKNLTIIFDVDPAVPEHVTGDAVRLNQILVNLIGNAIKFTQQGTVSVRMRNEGIVKNTLNTGIRISDTGIGIEQQKLISIFDRFQQAEDTVTRKFGGTGLGLAIVRELVVLQKGTIEVESTEGKGTSFHLMIPYELAEHEIATGDISVPVKPRILPNKDFRVLVAEDNRINQQLISILLKNRKIAFDLVGNGKEVLKQLSSRKYQLVLMDIQMPEMDGYSATAEIRNQLKSDIPIVAMTAHALQGERDKCIVFGMNDYLPKPIQEDQLDELIEKYNAGNAQEGDYQIINTEYLKDVSSGDRVFEKTVTAQFIQAIPEELAEMEKSWKQSDRPLLSKLSHNMRTTISVMGLNEIVSPDLDILENEDLNETRFRKHFSNLSRILHTAMQEAKTFQNQA